MVDMLFIGTHPDDLELGLGGSVALFAGAGKKITILDLTNGEPTPKGDPIKRAEESRRSAGILGVKERITLDLKNRELCDDLESRIIIAEQFRVLKPAMIFFQDGPDAHPDHMAGATLVKKARFHAKLTKTDMRGEPFYPPKLFSYYASHLPYVFEPTFIIDITSTFERKIESILAYKSQIIDTGNKEKIINRIEAHNRFYGEMIGRKYGEPIRSIEPLGLTGIDQVITV